MTTFSILIKGSRIFTTAFLLEKLKGTHFRYVKSFDHGTDVTFVLETFDEYTPEVKKRLNEWFAQDIHCDAPLPNGSLLLWNSHPADAETALAEVFVAH